MEHTRVNIVVNNIPIQDYAHPTIMLLLLILNGVEFSQGEQITHLPSNRVRLIDLVTVFDAILTSRQTREKLQCLYENLMSNNLRSTAVLEKNMNCKLKLHP